MYKVGQQKTACLAHFPLSVHYVQLYMYIVHVYRSIDTVGLSLFLLNQEPQMNVMNVKQYEKFSHNVYR